MDALARIEDIFRQHPHTLGSCVFDPVDVRAIARELWVARTWIEAHMDEPVDFDLADLKARMEEATK